MKDYPKMASPYNKQSVESQFRLMALPRYLAHRLGVYHHPGLRRLYRLAVRLLVQIYLSTLNVSIIAVTGTNGKTTTTRLIEKTIRNAGYHVGACTTEGVTHNGQLVWKGDASGVYGALKAAQCPHINVLVLETARGGIIKYGTGFRHCLAGIVTNVYEDHMGFDGIDSIEQMAAVKAAVAEHVAKKGTLVLNADNHWTRRMAKKSRAPAIYFTTGNDDGQFERLFFIRDHCIYKRINLAETFVMDAREIPITYRNIVSYNVENVMATLACLEGIQPQLPIDWDSIKQSLSSFGTDPKDNFNRFCILSFSKDQVILTRSKNPESCRRDMKIVERLRKQGHFKHVVGIMSGVGNRQQCFHEEMSEIAASTCDYFFIRPPQQNFLRGKTEEEIVKLVASSIPKERIISTRQSSLPEVIALSRKRLDGKILFIVLNIYIEEKIDFFDALKEADSINQLPWE
jgi:cyanophycin synthetase